jgi:ABC-type polysaccharide/polyol phosphate transport system ATPase subunit
MHSDVAISVKNLTKTYRIFGHPGDRIKQAFTFGRMRFHREFTALKDVSFEIKKGETIGIIGRNGSGKSTLLQLICGILKPTSGSVEVNGRISALLELGAGFNPEFTGRENVYFQGAVMGIPKEEMARRFDDIAAFADIGEFIDQPVRTYSSGMFVRLAFSLATAVEPDILVVDEALAVGDETFQRKCLERIEDLIKRQGRTVIFVSHNLRQMERICSRTILLEKGGVSADGLPGDICGIYYKQVIEGTHRQHMSSNIEYQSITGTGEIEVVSISLFRGEDDTPTDELEMHSTARIGIRFRAQQRLVSPELIVGFHTPDSVYVASTSSAVLQENPDFEADEHYVECVAQDMMLVPGVYHVRLAFIDQYRRIMWDGHGLSSFRVVPNAQTNAMRMPQLSLVDMPFKWRFAEPSASHHGTEAP